MIGALALAKQLDYRQAYDQYEKLNDATRSDLSPANFTRLKDEEKKIIVQGQDRIPLLLNELFEIETAINANEAAQKRQRLLGLISDFGVPCFRANLRRKRSKPELDQPETALSGY
jgi:hypothetical protein